MFKNLKSFFQQIEGRDLDKIIMMDKVKLEFKRQDRKK